MTLALSYLLYLCRWENVQHVLELGAGRRVWSDPEVVDR